MTARTAWRARLAARVRGFARLHATHPVRLLRWLRNGAHVCVAATLLICLGVAVQAHRRIAAADRTQDSIRNIGHASQAAMSAYQDLAGVFQSENVDLTGTGSEFGIDVAQVNTFVTAAAEGNAAGSEGETSIQFIQGQLATCIQLAESAVHDFDALKQSADSDALTCLTAPDQQDPTKHTAVADSGGLTAALTDLKGAQTSALDRQRISFSLSPLAYRWLPLTPSLIMLMLLVATGYLLASHFRRLVSPLLAGALLITVAVAIAFGVLSAGDEHHLYDDPSASHALGSDPWASHPVTITIEALAVVVAFALVHVAYRPRLAEYRFPGR